MKEFYDLLTQGAYATGGYFTLLTLSQLIENFCSQKINSQEELEEIAEEESRRIGLNPNSVIPVYVEKDNPNYKRLYGSRCKVEGYDSENDKFVSSNLIDDKKIICINIMEIKEGWGANRGTVRHEIYHLKKHMPRPKNRIRRKAEWIYQKPAATLYSLTGIKTI